LEPIKFKNLVWINEDQKLRTNSRIIDPTFPRKVKVSIKASTDLGKSVSKELLIDFTNVFIEGSNCKSCSYADFVPFLEEHNVSSKEYISIEEKCKYKYLIDVEGHSASFARM
jgi:hypothetical protein